MFHLLPLQSTAPDFHLLSHTGESVSLEDFRGKQNVALIFYPADNTFICTKQLCELRDAYETLLTKNIQPLALNPGDWEQHKQFAESQRFSFPLLFDLHAKVAKAYGAIWIPKLLVRRTVYGIDTTGKICFAKRGKPSVEEIMQAF